MTEKKELQQLSPDPFYVMVQSLAANPDVPVDKLRQIMDMQEHIMDKNAEQAFNAAMVRAQNKMPIVPRDKKNEQTNSMYSKYETILRLCKPVYTSEGFAVMFHEGEAKRENEVRIIAEVMHEQGHTKQVYTDIPLDRTGIKGTVNKTETHAKGSSIQYGRSYLMREIFNIPTGDDDDGNGAGTIYITEEQYNELDALLKENNLASKEQMEHFLKWLKIDALEHLPIKQFGRAKMAIKDAIKKAKKND